VITSEGKPQSIRRLTLIWLFSILITLSFETSSRAGAAEAKPEEGAYVLFSQTSGDWYTGSPIIERVNVIGSQSQKRLNPIVIGLCNAGAAELNVASFASSLDGVVNLKCGTVSDGYIHIRNRHQTSWENQNLGGLFWDDNMAWATSRALIAPASVIDRPGSKRCYTTPIQVFRYVNGAIQLVKTFNPTILVSTNNRIVITSIPTTKSSC